MRGAWGQEPFSFEGRHFRTLDALIRPAPRQQPVPPILIAGGGEQRFGGGWAGYAVAATPDRAIAMYRSLVEAGIGYFVICTLDATDTETIRLLVDAAIPAVAD